MENAKGTLPMHTLLLCTDVQFLGVTRGVLNELQVTPRIVSNCEDALSLFSKNSFDVLLVDWREISNLGEFLMEVRRSKHREPVRIVASVSTHSQPFAEVIVTNLSEGGAGLRLPSESDDCRGAHLNVGEEIDLRFTLPGSEVKVHSSGRVVWTTSECAGIRFSFIPEGEWNYLKSWLTECVERSLEQLCERLRTACA